MNCEMLRLPHTHSPTPAQHGGLDTRNEYIEKRTIKALIIKRYPVP